MKNMMTMSVHIICRVCESLFCVVKSVEGRGKKTN